MNGRLADAMRILERSRAVVEKARSNMLRARANNIRAEHLAQQAKATCYENHLIRGTKR